MKSPITDYKHWLTWTMISLGITLTTYLLTKQIASIYVFVAWFFSVMIIDLWMHKAGWQ